MKFDLTHPLQRFDRWKSFPRSDRLRVLRVLTQYASRTTNDEAQFALLDMRKLLQSRKSDAERKLSVWLSRNSTEYRSWAIRVLLRWAVGTNQWHAFTPTSEKVNYASYEAYLLLDDCMMRTAA